MINGRNSHSEHECEYKEQYYRLLEELNEARKEIQEKDARISELLQKNTENKQIASSLSANTSSLKSNVKPTTKSSSLSSSLSSSSSSFPPSSSKPLPPRQSIRPKSGLPPIDSRHSSPHFGFDLPENIRVSSVSPSLSSSSSPSSSSSSSTTTTTTTTSSSKIKSKPSIPSSSTSSLNSKPKQPTSKTSNGTITSSTVSKPKLVNSKPASNGTSYKSNPSPRITQSVSRSSDSEFNLRAYANGGLQVDDETYARILQDIEERKAIERGRHVLPPSLQRSFNSTYSPRNHSTNSTSHSSNSDYHASFLDSIRSTVVNNNRSSAYAGDEIGTSYEELSQLEDVCTGIPEDQIDHVITKLHVTSSMETSECPVCLDALMPGEEYTTLPCTHTFHYSCMRKCLAVKKTCPLCKVYVI